MSAFRNELSARKKAFDGSADGRGTWKLVEPLEYQSDLLKRTLTVPAGFVTDFASVPRIPVAFLLTGNSAHEAAVVHDWLYSTHEVDRATADAVFREACVACGTYGWKAWLMWAGVRVGGAGPYEAAGQPQPLRVTDAMLDAADRPG